MKIFRSITSILLSLLVAISILPASALGVSAAENLFGGMLVDGTDAILSAVAYDGKILVLTRNASLQ